MGLYLALVAIVSFVMNRIEKALRVDDQDRGSAGHGCSRGGRSCCSV